ncbi:hypothetical protein V8E51_016960 [Hyaloscypha variabilis]
MDSSEKYPVDLTETVESTSVPNSTKQRQKNQRKKKQIEAKPFRFMDLPKDIRNMIYEICFVRSLTIAPLRNFIRRRLYRREIVDDRRWKKYSAYQYQWDSYPAFAKAAENIPGFPHPDGDPQTVEQLPRCLEQLLDRQVHHNRFIWYDHFLHFLTRIGPFNTSKLKNVKFRGVFKTLNEDGYPRGSSVCFLNLLPIYTVVLDKVCTDLRKVTLELGEEGTSLIPPPFWSDLNILFEGPPTNKEVIGRTIQMLAEGIPRLQQLRLGDQDIPRTEDGRPAYNAPSKKPQNDVEESLALEEKLDNESGTPSHYVLLHFGGSWFESSHRLPAQHDPNISKALYNKLSLSHTETVPPDL